ncbi:hypothetical protein BEP19_04110 [Ammoniphilus oxalaticus]|uniref:Uncharacterized protein n=1 Tax=Ammoniphilus oxalaticus TaxID=66863 RepID=A0A419SLS1_9BACL|nr:hypothetical protein [Ammoniphilus oxalaticus]RKD25020.1 hypothetical protein BEP19_04110 [Ammoniphilus oxalaticus]
MKRSKKRMTALAFTVGASLFISTAFADALLGSGYDRLKTSVKTTAAQMEEGMDNYTVEMLVSIKDNDRTLVQMSNVMKEDQTKRMTENESVTQYGSGKSESHYIYSDVKQSISKHGSENKYYVTDYSDDPEREMYHMFDNPFKQQGAQEMEKIIDAMIGNLKEHVQAEERAEGGKLYSGSLSATQVPAIVNAVSSFGVKQFIRDQNRHGGPDMKVEEIESDIFVKKVTGTAIENKAGLLEHLTGEIILSGKDKNGAQREFSLQVVFNLSQIGSTKIAAPNLAGSDVETVSSYNGLSAKHIGTYKNNIVIEKDGQIVKIGERSLQISKIEDKNVSGTYKETIKPGFEADYDDPYEFSFQYKHSGSMPLFTYTTPTGKQENGQIHISSGKLYLDLGVEKMDEHSYRSNQRQNYDQEFNRVFEE